MNKYTIRKINKYLGWIIKIKCWKVAKHYILFKNYQIDCNNNHSYTHRGIYINIVTPKRIYTIMNHHIYREKNGILLRRE